MSNMVAAMIAKGSVEVEKANTHLFDMNTNLVVRSANKMRILIEVSRDVNCEVQEPGPPWLNTSTVWC